MSGQSERQKRTRAKTSSLAPSIVSALQNVALAPSEDRAGKLAVPASMIASNELESVRIALKNPPPKADVVTMLVGVVPSIGGVVKILFDASKRPLSVEESGVLVALAAIIGIQVWRFFDTALKKHPHHENAIAIVERSIEINADKNADGEDDAAGDVRAGVVASDNGTNSGTR